MKVFILILLFLVGNIAAFGQTETNSQEPSLANINWDDEVSEKEITSDSGAGLSDVDWDDEVSEEQKSTTPESGLNSVDWDSDEGLSNSSLQNKPHESVDKNRSFSHWLNGILFLVYFVGCFATAYFTRNRAITLRTPPEILILLHTFWPVELLLTPFIRQPGDSWDDHA